ILTAIAQLILKLVSSVARNTESYVKRSEYQPYNMRSTEELSIERARLTSSGRRNEAIKPYNKLTEKSERKCFLQF
ncbi:hypothetical protein WA026_012635, partial [Henosepilachna vigintioctopunctata]